MYKLVPEHINEVHNFERGKQNKLVSLGVGKIHLIKSWLDEMDIEDYVINDNLTINCINDIDLRDKNLVEFPEYIQFHKVGYFHIGFNKLISLRGCPKICLDSFWCNNNELKSLEGCPNYVERDFWCYNNKVQFIQSEVRKFCDVKGIIYV